jgi:type IV pilus assembly protein PilN
MAHINLLPWREERRQERQKQFLIGLGASLLLAGLLVYAWIFYVDTLINEQQERNTFLQSEIKKLDVKIKQISKLEEEREKLLARIQVIQDLQESRPKVVKVLDSIARTVPEGVFLTRVSRTGTNLSIEGAAQSNARVSVFMRELDSNVEFGESNLSVIQRSQAEGLTRKFALSVPEIKPKKENE